MKAATLESKFPLLDGGKSLSELIREGNYVETEFYVRYFPEEGKGELRSDDGALMTPNDLFPLKRDVFRPYYTSLSDGRHAIDVYVEDNFGQVTRKTFTFDDAGTKNESKAMPARFLKRKNTFA